MITLSDNYIFLKLVKYGYLVTCVTQVSYCSRLASVGVRRLASGVRSASCFVR